MSSKHKKNKKRDEAGKGKSPINPLYVNWAKRIATIALGWILKTDWFSANFSELLGDYTAFLIARAVVLAGIIYLFLYVFGVWPWLNRIVSSAKEKTVGRRAAKLLRLVIALSPLAITSILFCFDYEWRYTDNKFKPSEVGILIAEFREVLLDEYLSQKNFCTMLKEELQDAQLGCAQSAPIAFATTPAYFTSQDEARQFGEKMGAAAVIWGQVDKSQKTVVIRPRMAMPPKINYGTKNFPISVISLESRFSQNWRLDGTPPTIDSTVMQLDYFLGIPILVLAKTGRLKFPTKQYIDCYLKKRPLAVGFVRAFLQEERGYYHQSRGEIALAIDDYKGAYESLFLERPDSDLVRHSAFLALCLAKLYPKIQEADSSEQYLDIALNRDRSVVLKDSDWMLQIVKDQPTKAKNMLLHFWNSTRDSSAGSWLLQIYEGERSPAAIQFRSAFDSICPSTFSAQQRNSSPLLPAK